MGRIYQPRIAVRLFPKAS